MGEYILYMHGIVILKLSQVLLQFMCDVALARTPPWLGGFWNALEGTQVGCWWLLVTFQEMRCFHATNAHKKLVTA